MIARGSPYIIALAALIVIGSLPSTTCAQCYGALGLGAEFFEYDYLVRLAVHFGSEQDVPQVIMCSRARLPEEDVVDVPIWFYNAQEGITRLEFAVESNDTLLDFVPASGWNVHHKSYFKCEAPSFQLNVKINSDGPACGPGLAGWAVVRPAPESQLTWITLVPNRHTGRMYAVGLFNDGHPVFSPQYGGTIGSNWLYTCQQPICPEPAAGVTGFTAHSPHGYWVRLSWTDGAGNVTVIRARSDRYPTGHGDGRLVVEMPGIPGSQRTFYDTEAPLGELVYYKAFSLIKDAGGGVLNVSFVECAALDTVTASGVIGVEEASWGQIKQIPR